MKELLGVFFLSLGVGLILWCLFGLLLLPIFGKNMITLHFCYGGGAELEQAVRAYGWLRDGKKQGGVLLLVDCGLDAEGLDLALRLRARHDWVSYCPRAALTDYIELLEDTV